MINESHGRVLRLKRIAKLLDSQFQGPFGTRFGLDGLLGLIPGIGDIITTILSGFILVESYRLGASTSILIRMGMNILLENLVDTIPLFGNLFDFYWKANNKNVQLLDGYLSTPQVKQRESRLILILILFFILGLISFSLWILYLLFQLIFEAFALFTS